MNPIDPLIWAIALIALGFALLVLDVMIPSGGILSFLALLSILGGVWLAFSRDLSTGLAVTAITLFAAPLVIGLAFKVLPHTPMGRAFLGRVPSPEDTQVEDSRRRLVGRLGVAQSKMLPSGTVLVEGELIDALSQGVAIEMGELVVVQEVRANRVVVRRATREEHEQATAHGFSSERGDPLTRPVDEFGLEPLDNSLG